MNQNKMVKFKTDNNKITTKPDKLAATKKKHTHTTQIFTLNFVLVRCFCFDHSYLIFFIIKNVDCIINKRYHLYYWTNFVAADGWERKCERLWKCSICVGTCNRYHHDNNNNNSDDRVGISYLNICCTFHSRVFWFVLISFSYFSLVPATDM